MSPDTQHTIAQSPDPYTSQEFGLMLGGTQDGNVLVFLDYQKVRWHLTPEQAEALGTALVNAAHQANDMRLRAPVHAQDG